MDYHQNVKHLHSLVCGIFKRIYVVAAVMIFCEYRPTRRKEAGNPTSFELTSFVMFDRSGNARYYRSMGPLETRNTVASHLY